MKKFMLSGLELLRGPEEQAIEIVDGKLSARPTYLATTGQYGSRLPLLRIHKSAESLDFPGEFTFPLQAVTYERMAWVGKNQCILLTKMRSDGSYDKDKVMQLDAVLCWLGFEEDILQDVFQVEP
jgi:hypothetical protein